MRTARVVSVRVVTEIADIEAVAKVGTPDESLAAMATPLDAGALEENGRYGPLTGWMVTQAPVAGWISLKPSQCSFVPPR
jgi:hypothetical protein